MINQPRPIEHFDRVTLRTGITEYTVRAINDDHTEAYLVSDSARSSGFWTAIGDLTRVEDGAR
ncbi:MAG: hypothetical protein ABW022_07300 [Actinoplanes sp.]